jgi:hypothetical protein
LAEEFTRLNGDATVALAAVKPVGSVQACPLSGLLLQKYITAAPAGALPVVNDTLYWTLVAPNDELDNSTERLVAVAANAVVSGAASRPTIAKAVTRKPKCLPENFVCFT